MPIALLIPYSILYLLIDMAKIAIIQNKQEKQAIKYLLKKQLFCVSVISDRWPCPLVDLPIPNQDSSLSQEYTADGSKRDN